MIIARARNDEDGTEILLLGLTRRNVDELLKGHPVRITSATHGPGVPLGWTIGIVVGETEAAIAAELRRTGLITADTKVVAMPRDADPPRNQ
jgi:hypothetical protein